MSSVASFSADPVLSAALDRNLALDVARVTEAAAIAAARYMGRGDERAADLAATAAMREALTTVPMAGTITLGALADPDDGLFRLGEGVGNGTGLLIDVGVTPLEGATICAMGAPNATACMALARKGELLAVPPVYMEKIAVGPGVPEGCLSLDADPAENIRALAKVRGVPAEALLICVLDRPRNEALVDRVRSTGARITLISDGDVSGAVAVGLPETGVDMYMGSGGAAEGVLAAAGLRCLGGVLQGRLMVRGDSEKAAVRAAGITDPDRILTMADMVPGETMFAATGVTDGALLRGVRLHAGSARSSTLVMRSRTGTLRFIDTRHDLSKLSADR
ncbi:class II fructose-bisphosphatase [Rhodospirillum rubrum]|uniref:Fructose-1,6-bisphosphatase n=1 Tax=Rhodospirillum rubrum (strain ATCC 11170 / ATH 1.1.1 / DSM 467 / LMG 4362 / NCIMB 8255 / S1) TaxID=269796 RepID=Q2RRN6_RHORT|nr:class II fructose-bisphosphatase [Rhodospirillum rubrum]ABC23209.1 GlpX [Rhodospirillum rubrum ATCC 11170]AEO48940.1 fructose 1,6-bisphosphatase II [Rhodospirillum rubrum F11]MBK5954843.1 fructose-bisphosphatase class II [Rhodospirillum rubrum]QXG79186.1 class II fructose-bisphosphatase [Rhodospirillum rubrum]HAP99530.1 fructose-bisphosphatase class II [Rhodospirillum rubrum]